MIKLANQLSGTGREWVRPWRLPLIEKERARIETLVRRAQATPPARLGAPPSGNSHPTRRKP